MSRRERKEPMQVLVRLKLHGTIHSKKNGTTVVWKGGKPRFLGNLGYNKRKNEIRDELRAQFAGQLDGPLHIQVVLYLRREHWVDKWNKGKQTSYKGSDIDNKLNSIFDLLTYAKVIFDDSQFVSAVVSKRFGKLDDDYGAEIVIMRAGDGEQVFEAA